MNKTNHPLDQFLAKNTAEAPAATPSLEDKILKQTIRKNNNLAYILPAICLAAALSMMLFGSHQSATNENELADLGAYYFETDEATEYNPVDDWNGLYDN